MRRLLLVAAILFVTIFLGVTFYQKKETNNNVVKYELQGKSYMLLIADNEEEWAKGLMNVRDLKEDGMIFLFPDKKLRNFWNKNTFVDLDIIWLNDDNVVGKSYLPSIEKSKDIVTVTSPQPSNKVVELVR